MASIVRGSEGVLGNTRKGLSFARVADEGGHFLSELVSEER
jgi:hypothetical protein